MVFSPVVIARNSLPLWPVVSYSERSPPEKIPLSSFNHFRISTWNSRFFFWKKWNSKMTIMKLARCPTLQSFPHDLTVQKRRLVLPLRNNTTWSWGKPCRLHSKPIFKFIFFEFSTHLKFSNWHYSKFWNVDLCFFSHLPRWWPVGIGYKRS